MQAPLTQKSEKKAGHKPPSASPVLELSSQANEAASTTLPFFLRGSRLQTKLAIGGPSDPLEEEAERKADLVTRAPFGTLQRKCNCGGSGGGECETCRDERLHAASVTLIQRSAAGPVRSSDPSPIVNQVLQSPGHPLDLSTRDFMESRFGHDFRGVQIHADERAAQSAQAVNALAYTVGNHVVFDRGQYSPGSTAGRRLLAHELTHVVQQGAGPRLPSSTPAHHQSASRESAKSAKAPVRSGRVTSKEEPQSDDCHCGGACDKCKKNSAAAITQTPAPSANAAYSSPPRPRPIARAKNVKSRQQNTDRWEHEADAVSSLVLMERPVEVPTLTPTETPRIQRYSWDDFTSDVGGAAHAIAQGAEDVGHAVASGAEAAGDAVVSGAESVANAAGQAADWLLTETGKLLLQEANAIAGLFGGSVVVRGGCLVVNIPEIPLFPSFQKTLGETPEAGFFIPILEGGTMLGPIPVAGAFGILGYAQASLEAAVGPGVVRSITLELCPFRGHYSAMGQLYVAAAIAPRLTLFGGLAAVVGTAIPMDPPIPIIAILQGGVRGTGTGWLIGAVQDTVMLDYTGGRFSFSNVTDFMAGILLQGDLDLFAALRLYEKIVCQYVHPLGHWETGRAWRLTIPIHAALGGGTAGTGGVGPITFGPMPIEDIQTAIRPLPSGWNCLSWAEIKKILCDNGVLPPELCDEEEEQGPSSIGPFRKQLALAICKCVGDDDCGGGRMYRMCFEVDDNTCKNKGKLQKEADDRCNNAPGMADRCRRPKCYYRHTDAKCPVKENECTDGHFGTDQGPGSAVTPGGPGGPTGPPLAAACTYTITYSNIKNLGCSTGQCGAKIQYDITKVTASGSGCPPDLNGLKITEKVDTDEGCSPGKVTTGPGCPIGPGGVVTGCTDTYALCLPTKNVPAAGCTEIYTQDLFVGGDHAETHTITFTLVNSSSGCSGTVSRS